MLSVLYAINMIPTGISLLVQQTYEGHIQTPQTNNGSSVSWMSLKFSGSLVSSLLPPPYVNFFWCQDSLINWSFFLALSSNEMLNLGKTMVENPRDKLQLDELPKLTFHNMLGHRLKAAALPLGLWPRVSSCPPCFSPSIETTGRDHPEIWT